MAVQSDTFENIRRIYCVVTQKRMLNVQQVRLRFAFAKLLVSASSLFKNTDSKTYGASTVSSDVLYAHKTRLQMVSQSQFFRGFYLFYLMRLAICQKNVRNFAQN